MKKLLLVFLVLAFCTATAWAKSLSLYTEFSFDTDFEPELTMFKLYHRDINTAEYILINEVTDVTARAFNTPVFDLPPGKTADFFLAAVYKDGTESLSPMFQWKFTGQPRINKLTRN